MNIIDSIEKFMIKNNKIFFSYAWRENITEMLSNESKYQKLVEWINKRIESEQIALNVFNPADKSNEYTNEQFNAYKTACQNIAMLINIKYIILDNKCTIQMRENCEYAICKIFNVHYNEFLNIYV
jgi:hypothetical protein